MAFSADRLFGINANSSTEKVEQNGQSAETKESTTTIALLWGSSSSGGTVGNPSAIPRLSFDYFVMDGLSVGGSLGYFAASGTVEAGGQKNDLTKVSGWAFAPRVVYALMFTDMIGFWPRGGITYWNAGSETQGTNKVTTTASGFDLNIEAPFIITPTPHFAFTAGPLLDFGVSGSVKTDPNPTNAPEPSLKHTNFGLAFGILGYL